MTDTLFTIQEYNEYNAYDKLYPKTHASLIVNPPQATGARIDVLCLPASSGIVVNLSGQKTASATTDSNGKCSFEGLDYGEYTISATISGSEKSETVSIDASKIYDVSLGISKTLNDNSWEVISAVSKAGLASTYWSVGDAKAVTLNGTLASGKTINKNLYVYIIDFNHTPSSSSGTPDGISFCGFKSAQTNGIELALVDGQYNESISRSTGFIMYTSGTNVGGWKNSYMRHSSLGSVKTSGSTYTSSTAVTEPLSNSLMSCLPSDLRTVMQLMYVYSDNTGGNSAPTPTITSDYLILPSEFEVYGVSDASDKAKQSQYTYWAQGNTRIRYNSNNNNNNAVWWLRTPLQSNSASFITILATGFTSISAANRSLGIAPIFKV